MKKTKKLKGTDHLEEEEGKKPRRRKWTDEDRKANAEYSEHHIGHNIENFFNSIQASI